MTIDALIMLSGAFVAALPFLGFPNSWDTFFFLCAGIFIIALGIVVRRRLGQKTRALKDEELSATRAPRYEDPEQ
ncbi:hypothetical protein A3C18_01375 [Candidatus Kaiserbacteria bacterium RIFCSPHIGHO2_02_FULL_54_11b]|uniref:Uncharacterized protein n=2 Tax=Candidatus Kaiseribacteriota TaxID=1752734 RepID=A0A1F6CR89_9BACT|nr:MAG: hypothetical protein A2704_05090 [Candidatus Kaiserbacteria bacterium RIFCSPHIGHO2_01_FULL_54_36b]OGG64025.1 MAG: hypothetical protein A3C18_01375 [Candidatus Kaiserbacteria bacterium RIFCSPHIGHO2_02_FULL_54_11b]